MATKPKLTVYWDSNVFISWINEVPERLSVIEGMWNEIVVEKKGIIVTSAFSIAEVANAAYEKQNYRIDPAVENQIEAMWADPNILIVEAPSTVMRIARKIMRDAIPFGWALRPNDAIHLATAKFLEVNGRMISEINTYDDLGKYKGIINIDICEPHFEPKPHTKSMFEHGVKDE